MFSLLSPADRFRLTPFITWVLHRHCQVRSGNAMHVTRARALLGLRSASLGLQGAGALGTRCRVIRHRSAGASSASGPTGTQSRRRFPTARRTSPSPRPPRGRLPGSSFKAVQLGLLVSISIHDNDAQKVKCHPAWCSNGALMCAATRSAPRSVKVSDIPNGSNSVSYTMPTRPMRHDAPHATPLLPLREDLVHELVSKGHPRGILAADG